MFRRALIPVSLAVLCSLPCWAGSQNTQGNIPCEQLTELRENAEHGDGRAKYELARLYLKGECIPKDWEKSARLLHEADSAGYAPARTFLAALMEQTGHYGEAFPPALAAARQGDAMGQGILAYLYAYGKGTEQNDQEAVTWAKLAANQNNYEGQIVLSVLFQNGRGGLNRDIIEADKWMILARKTDNTDSVLTATHKLLESTMSPKEIQTAHERAAVWKPEPAEK